MCRGVSLHCATRGKVGVLGEEGEARASQLLALLVEVRGVVPLEGVNGDSAGHATEGHSYESSLLAHLACTQQAKTVQSQMMLAVFLDWYARICAY